MLPLARNVPVPSLLFDKVSPLIGKMISTSGFIRSTSSLVSCYGGNAVDAL